LRPVAVVLAVAALTLLVVAYRRPRNGWDLAGAGFVAVALTSDFSRWPAIHVQVGPAEVALIAATLVAYFNLVGFPRLVVRHLGFGYRSAEWSFDRRLYDEKARLDRLLLEYRSSDDEDVYRRWRRRVLARGGRILRDMTSLKAPSADWAPVRDGYVQLYRDILDRIERDEGPDDLDTMRRGTALKNHADVLRIAYRTAARQWVKGSDRH
jgi:hypothetical protein